ncbi:MAG: SufE family protein [Alphaproteobacteria bacterium]
MTINAIAEDFAALDDWEDRYKYLIDLGNSLPPMDDSLKTEASKVKGCMSQVWMLLSWDGGKLTLLADSDAQIVRGLIAVLRALFVGKTVAEIENIDVEKTFRDLGLEGHISPNRRNGFFSMVEVVRAFTSRRT